MALLSEITPYFTISSFLIILLLGTIGSTLNLITLLSKDFRTKSCIFYLICSSSLDLIFSNCGIIIRLATEYFGNNLNNLNRGICKVRAYFLVCLPIMASTCVFLATFARRLFIIVMSFLLISSIFHLIIYDLCNGTCAPLPGLQTFLVSAYAVAFALLVPHTGMLICGILTWIHIQQSKNRIVSIVVVHSQRRGVQHTNRQLLILTFVHASLSTIIAFQRCTTYSYNVITSSVKKSIERQQIEYFIQQVSTVLYYINFGMAFYINYAGSTMFRKSFRLAIRGLMHRCFWFSERH